MLYPKCYSFVQWSCWASRHWWRNSQINLEIRSVAWLKDKRCCFCRRFTWETPKAVALLNKLPILWRFATLWTMRKHFGRLSEASSPSLLLSSAIFWAPFCLSLVTFSPSSARSTFVFWSSISPFPKSASSIFTEFWTWNLLSILLPNTLFFQHVFALILFLSVLIDTKRIPEVNNSPLLMKNRLFAASFKVLLILFSLSLNSQTLTSNEVQ